MAGQPGSALRRLSAAAARLQPTVTPAQPTPVRAGRPGAPRRAPAPDPVAALIATSERHFDAGQRELAEGHLEQARREFDRVGRRPARVARRRPRRRRGSATISIAWSIASAPTKWRRWPTGDGFTEKPSEPASIDELLAIARPSTRRRAGRRDRRRPSAPICADRARHPDSAERSRARLRRAVPGPPARVHRSRAWSAAPSTCR